MKPIGLSPTVLVVEDEAIIGLDIKRLLSAAGYTVSGIASTADEAIRKAEVARPDIVLMDIHIKGTRDGIETASYIRQTLRLPVIFVTAHSDKSTLDRARETQPFGYVVKPISALGLTSTIEMALQRHDIELQRDEQSAWLTTVLQDIPDAVIVSNLAGTVQFLNSAAEHLLGVPRSDALDQPVDEVLPLLSGEFANLASRLLGEAVTPQRVSLPKDALLISKSRKVHLAVEGDVVVSYRGDRPAGAIFTLRDVSRREREERIERQEDRMLALGRLASGIAHDFTTLHALVGSACHDLAALANCLSGRERNDLLDKTDTINRVTSIAALMTEELNALSSDRSAPATLVDAAGIIVSIEPLLNKIRGSRMQVDTHLTDESTLVLCPPDRLSILLVHVFLIARERMNGVGGRIRISTHQNSGDLVSILFELEQWGDRLPDSQAFTPEMDDPNFCLSIARALAMAMDGSISFAPVSKTQARVEILLPLQFATHNFLDAINCRGTVLLIGADPHLSPELEGWLAERCFAVVRCSDAAEALVLGQLCTNKIDCVIAESYSLSATNSRKLRTFFSNRNSGATFVRLVSQQQADEAGWQSFVKSPPASLLAGLNRIVCALSEICRHPPSG